MCVVLNNNVLGLRPDGSWEVNILLMSIFDLSQVRFFVDYFLISFLLNVLEYPPHNTLLEVRAEHHRIQF